MLTVPLSTYIESFESSPLAPWAASEPWSITAQSEQIVRRLLAVASLSAFSVSGEVAIHHTTVVEAGAVLKGPLILGPDCFVATGAYLRGGCWVEERCTFGPGAELKSSFVFAGTKLAHFNFVGDSILGTGVNLEAGSIICNYRNERADKEIVVRIGKALRRTGCQKFGAIIGDHSRIGANAVVAPGALLDVNSIVPRGSLLDQEAPDEGGA